MPVEKNQTQVEWSGNVSQAVASGGNETSDAVTIDAAAISAVLQVKAKHSGTPASGDLVMVYVLYTAGDPDADPDSADEYDTQEHAIPIVLDLEREDPAVATIPLEPAAKGFVLAVDNEAAASVTVSAQVSEQVVS